jgi:hypothetical protein
MGFAYVKKKRLLRRARALARRRRNQQRRERRLRNWDVSRTISEHERMGFYLYRNVRGSFGVMQLMNNL